MCRDDVEAVLPLPQVPHAAGVVLASCHEVTAVRGEVTGKDLRGVCIACEGLRLKRGGVQRMRGVTREERGCASHARGYA